MIYIWKHYSEKRSTDFTKVIPCDREMFLNNCIWWESKVTSSLASAPWFPGHSVRTQLGQVRILGSGPEHPEAPAEVIYGEWVWVNNMKSWVTVSMWES